MLPSLTPPKGFLFSYPETLPPLIKIDKKEDLLTNQAAFIIQKTFRNFISKRNNDLKEKLIESFDSHILREDFSRLEVNRVSIIKSLIQNIFPLVLEMAYSKKPILKREKLRSFKNQTIKNIFSLLPGMKSPTVVPLVEEGWSSIQSVVNENDFWEVIEKLKQFDAEGIIVIPIEKMIV